MKKSTLTVIFLILSSIGFSQTISTKYYNNRWLQKEVTEKKARFSQLITQNPDGSMTTEVRNLKTDEVIRSETYKGQEPSGIWIIQTGKGSTELDFNFPMKYSDKKCSDSIADFKNDDYFQDNESLGYKAPKISTGQATLIQFLAEKIYYPARAREEGMQGKVFLSFTVTKEGDVENIYVYKGANVLLDKEALRVLRQLKFSKPATLKGVAQSFCVTIPVSFRLM